MGEGGDLLWIRKIYLISKCTSTRIRPRIDFFCSKSSYTIISFRIKLPKKKKVNTLKMSLYFKISFNFLPSLPHYNFISSFQTQNEGATATWICPSVIMRCFWPFPMGDLPQWCLPMVLALLILVPEVRHSSLLDSAPHGSNQLE